MQKQTVLCTCGCGRPGHPCYNGWNEDCFVEKIIRNGGYPHNKIPHTLRRQYRFPKHNSKPMTGM